MDGAATDGDSIVGDECHINSAAPGGPRFDPGLPMGKVDDYSNLLLLCKVHHKLVDDQASTFTAEHLQSIKAKHERWIEDRLKSSTSGGQPVRTRRVPENVPEFLRRIRTGRELLEIVTSACASSSDYDELRNESEFDLVSGFLQNTQDWAELELDEVGDRMRAAKSLDEHIQELERSGFWVFGWREDQVVEGGDRLPSGWPVAHLRVLRSDNPEIIRSSENDGELDGDDSQ